MSVTAVSTPVIDKTRELCTAIADDESFKALQSKVETFLNNDEAKLQYKSVHERGEQLHQKQHSGVELGATEIKEFESAREALFDNEIARDFMAAQQELEKLQKEIGKYVGMTLELGRVPTDEEIEEANGGGCCGGGGGEGCCG